MASYKINGYDLYLAFGLLPDQDRSTANSFESTPDVVPVFSHDWGNGIIEYDLLSPTYLKPKVFVLKATFLTESLEEYKLTKLAIESVIYQNYVTIEEIELEEKYNAKLRPGSVSWNRLTNFVSYKILVAVQFQFDEVKQNVPFKDDGRENITFLVNSEMKFYNTQDNKFMII